MIIADTSGLLALFNHREPAHVSVRHAVEAADDLLVVSPYVLAELDYLLASRLGIDAELTVLDEISGGAYELAQLTADDVATCAQVIRRYRALDLGVADASLVVLSHRYGTRSLLTLDRRHFGVVSPLDGGQFELVGL